MNLMMIQENVRLAPQVITVNKIFLSVMLNLIQHLSLK